MKTNKIIAGVSALVMAAANVCAVSAQSVLLLTSTVIKQLSQNDTKLLANVS